MYYLKRLTDVQWSGLAISSQAIVIEDAISKVRVLLDLTQDYAGAYSMSRACRNENSIACMHRHPFDAILNCAIRDGAAKRFARHIRTQSHAHLCAFTRGDDVPHFRLPNATGSCFMLLRVCVIRMNLYGEFFLRKDKFYQ